MVDARLVIFCDIGGVLVLNNASQLYREFEASHGVDAETLRGVWQFIQRAERTEEELERELRRVGLSLGSWESFVRRFRRSEQSNEKLIQFFLSIRETDEVFLFATSNNNRGNGREFSAMLERFRIDKIVEHVIMSSELGATKPDPEFWIRAKHFCSSLGVVVDDSRILVIDDDTRNCRSALDLGMNAVQYSECDGAFTSEVKSVVNRAVLNLR